jgi:nucleoside 2-deoxyribosyltransferase
MSRPGKKSVYIAGPLTDLSAEKRAMFREFYDSLGAVCAEFGLEPYIPHHHSDPAEQSHLTPLRVDQLDRLAVTQAYLVVAYVGVPSLGVGIEIEIAYHASKPVVILAEQTKLVGKRITRLVRGNPAVMAEIAFRDFEDAKIQLHQFLLAFTTELAESDLPQPLRIETEL